MAYPDDNLSDKLSLITASTVPTALTGISAGQDVLTANFAGLKELVENLQAMAAVLKDQKFYTPVGSIMPFAGASTESPAGWLLCAGINGTPVTSSAYPDLFNVLTANGTVYPHGGSGSTTYTPDLRGRTIAGLDNMGGTDAGRLDWANTLGTAGGAQTLPAHTHTGTTSTNGNHSHNVYFRYIDYYGTSNYSPAGNAGQYGFGNGVQSGDAGSHNHTFTTDPTGTGTHGVMQPTILLNYIIKV